MVPNAAHKANMGEWSELYALVFLLVNGGAFAADEFQNSNANIFHQVKQIHFAPNSDSPEIDYVIHEDDISIHVGGSETHRVAKSVLETAIQNMLNELKHGGHKSTFPLRTGNDLLNLVQRQRISPSSVEHENDLELVLVDSKSRLTTPPVGFNIKSQLGGRSTLLNASGATNFIYRVVQDDPRQINSLPKFEHGKHRQNLLLLYSAGYHVEFYCIPISQVLILFVMSRWRSFQNLG